MAASMIAFVALITASGVQARPGKEPPIVPRPAAVDISKVRHLLDVYHDGKGHHVVLMGASASRNDRPAEHVYYGDGKVFYRQSARWTANKPEGSFLYTIREPRVYSGYSPFIYRDGKATFKCEKRVTELRLAVRDRADALLKKAKFHDLYWTREPHALARNDEGVYYYVDRLVSHDPYRKERRGLRVFVGTLGKMRRMRMRKLVADEGGEILATDRGELRLVLGTYDNAGKGGATWIEGEKRASLVWLPVKAANTRLLIFRDLGVYAGQKLHRPCDDL